MAEFPIFTPPSPSPFFNLPKQPDYSGGIAAGISGIGDSFRANRVEDMKAQQLADENAYRNAQIETEKRGQDITAAHYAADAGPGGEKWFGNTVPVVGKDGTPKLLMYSDRGNSRELPMPEGYKPTGGKIQFHDMGSWWAATDNFGNPVTDDNGVAIKWQKDLAGKAAQEAGGAITGKNIAALPTILANAERNLATLKQVRDHPGKSGIWGTGIGGTGMLAPITNAIPGTQSYDFQTKVNQVKSQAFLTAYDQLRGAGAITEDEGAKATAAITSLDTATTEEAFNTALDDLEDVITKGIAKAKAMAASGPGAPGTAAPAIAPLFPPAVGAAPAGAAAPTATAPISAEDWLKGAP